MNFGKELDNTIKQKGMTKKQFAEMIGVAQSSVTRYTKNEFVPSNDIVVKMEAILDIKDERFQKIIKQIRKENKETHVEKKEINKKNTEMKILSVWKRGERTPYEVSKITGYSLRTVSKYLPTGGYE